FDLTALELTAQREAAEKRRSCVVWMPLNFSGEGEELAGRSWSSERFVQAQSRDRYGGAAAEACAHGNVGANIDLQSGRRTAEARLRHAKRFFNPVFAH